MSRRTRRLLVAAGLAAWLVNALILWIGASPLAHDEAQYANAASDLLAGTAPRWIYLSSGMSVLAIPGVLAGGSEHALRFLPFVLSFGFVVAGWDLARRVVGDDAAAWVIAVLAASRNIVRWSTELLSDLPATACLLAATAVILTEVTRAEGVRWRVVVAAPLLAAAFYIRYGSCVPIAIVVAVALAVGWRAIASRPLPVLATAALFVALLVPHAISAVRWTGSPLGILLESRGVPQAAYTGEGLVTYVTSNPFVFFGVPTPFVLLAGLATIRRGDRRARALWVISVASIVAIGLTAIAQPRYIFFGVTGLVILGTGAIVQAVAGHPRIGRVLAVALAACGIAVAIGRALELPRRHATWQPTLAASAAIRNQHRAPCYIYGTHYTQLEHYSGCRSAETPPDRELASGAPMYVVIDATPGWQPDLAAIGGRQVEIFAIPNVIRVVRVERP